ncbi:MAG: hypothetical protein A2Y93_02695 [Chloroflexi bacterium RBG_13_68_17]|nr:MAG: hypothetical protein A2Y93_02695 [Chloroflexi bacterium RBG_13_68_17]
MSNLPDTQPVRAARPPRRPASRWFLAVPILALAVVVVGAATGWVSGQRQTQAEEALLETDLLQEQFDLGVQDLLAARYELARQRFEYILSLEPAYPGAAELLGETLNALNVPTPSPWPTPVPPTATATLDISSLESLFVQAQGFFNQGDWTGTIQALLAVRERDPSYRLTEINGLLAGSLRNRGLDKISSGLLEQGIYDLNLAERFGPLDSQAVSWRSSAAFYLLANSYIGLDWLQAEEYFSSLCGGGTWDSCRKFALAALSVGDLFMGTPDPCGAIYHYQLSLDTFGNAVLVPTATNAMNLCFTVTATLATFTPTITTTPGTPTPPLVTPTVTPSLAIPTDTPTPTETETPTPTV